MEKDYFQDRTLEVTKRNAIHKGMYVFICEKHAQKYAKTMDDLTCVKVIDVLTKHDHPRGIKVRGQVLEPCEAGYRITEKTAIGRVIYIGRICEG